MDLNFPKDGSFQPLTRYYLITCCSLLMMIRKPMRSLIVLEVQEEAFANIFSLKEQGNSFFKKNFFCDAANTYLKAIKFLCVIVTAISEILQEQDRESIIKELAIPLHLNFVACAIKMSNFKEAILFSSMVLCMDPSNVKALYRRGISYSKSSCFEEARLDLYRAKKLDGKNIEICNSLQFVEETLKGKTSQSWEPQSPSSSPISMDSSKLNDGKLGHSPTACLSSMDVDDLIEKSQQPNRNKTNISSPLEVETKVSSVEVVAIEDRAKANQRNSPDVIKISIPNQVVHSSKTSDLNGHAPRPSSKNLSSKGKVVFINRKKPGSSLQLSREDVNRLRNGTKLTFFNSHSLTTLKVKTFKNFQIPSQMDDLMEAHQNHHVRVAEVSECEGNLSAYRSVEVSKDLITLSKDDPNCNPIVEVNPIVLQVESKAVEDFQVKDLPFFSATSSPKTLQAKTFTSPIKGGKEIKSP